MSPRTRAFNALADHVADHKGWEDDPDEGLAHRRVGRVYAVIIPTTNGRAYDVVCRDLISGVLIKEVRDLNVDDAVKEANRLLRPL